LMFKKVVIIYTAGHIMLGLKSVKIIAWDRRGFGSKCFKKERLEVPGQRWGTLFILVFKE
jgi:hypothetical protein